MDSNQLTNALVDAAAAAKPAQEYCLVLIQQEWWSCMTKAEWSGWMQAVGALVGLGIAIALPWCDRRRKLREDKQKVASDAGITLCFYGELLDTNDALLDVALAHLPNGRHERHPDARSEILKSIRLLRSLPFEQIRVIGFHNTGLASDLADFHCEREKLVGVLDRNADDGLARHLRTVVHRVTRLKELADSIKRRAGGS